MLAVCFRYTCLLYTSYQKTDYGLSDAFQSDTSFSCDSYSVGFGGRINFTQALSLDVAYFWTTYSDYTKENVRGLGAVSYTHLDVYKRQGCSNKRIINPVAF